MQDKTEVAKTCPNCGPAVKLIVRTNKENGTKFLGCPNWPRCEHTEEIPESIRMQLIGAERLPGF